MTIIIFSIFNVFKMTLLIKCHNKYTIVVDDIEYLHMKYFRDIKTKLCTKIVKTFPMFMVINPL